MKKILFLVILSSNLLLANKSYSINLSFPVNDELNQITIRKDFKLTDKLYLCPSLGLIYSLVNVGIKYDQTLNHKGFIMYSGIGYTPYMEYWGPGLLYRLSPSYQWKTTEYIYFNLGVIYNMYYDLEEKKLYLPTKVFDKMLSGILPFLQLSIKF